MKRNTRFTVLLGIAVIIFLGVNSLFVYGFTIPSMASPKHLSPRMTENADATSTIDHTDTVSASFAITTADIGDDTTSASIATPTVDATDDTTLEPATTLASDTSDIIPGVSEYLSLSGFDVNNTYPEPNFSDEELNEIHEYADSGTTQAFIANRELSELESNRGEKLSEMFCSGTIKPSSPISTKQQADTVCFDKSKNLFTFPDRDMTDDELLQVIEFIARINYALNLRAEQLKPVQEPTKSDINEQKAVEIGVAATEDLFLVDTADMNVVASFFSMSPTFVSQWLIRIAPYNRSILLKNDLDFGEYAVFIDSKSGIVTDAKVHSTIFANAPLTATELAELANNSSLRETAMEVVLDRLGETRSITDVVVLESEEHNKVMTDNRICTPEKDFSRGLVDVFVQIEDGTFYIVQMSYPDLMLKNLSYYNTNTVNIDFD